MMEHDNVRKSMYICMCNWINMLYSRKNINNVLRKLKKKKEIKGNLIEGFDEK